MGNACARCPRRCEVPVCAIKEDTGELYDEDALWCPNCGEFKEVEYITTFRMNELHEPIPSMVRNHHCACDDGRVIRFRVKAALERVLGNVQS